MLDPKSSGEMPDTPGTIGAFLYERYKHGAMVVTHDRIRQWPKRKNLSTFSD